MGDKSNIEWTDATWNPISGCTKVGPGCDNCYAEHIAERRLKGTKAFPNGFALTWRPHLLNLPLRWTRPRRIFVNSMSDLFHEHVVNPPKDGAIPVCALHYIFNRMEEADQHIYQILTKRSSLMRDFIKHRYDDELAPEQIWCGVSVEDRQRCGRIKHLRDTAVQTRFISFEPLLGPIGEVDLTGIDWAIVGGESGPNARPMDPFWVRELRDQCAEQGVAFFFKQWGGKRKPVNDPAKYTDDGVCILDGVAHLNFPDRRKQEELI